MKKLLILFALMLICAISMAQQPNLRLRTIVFGDIKDRSIGTGVEKNLDHFKMMCDNIAAGLDLDEDPTEYIGNECSKEYLMKWIKSFKCDDNDIVVFCYLGHGARSRQDTSAFPQMCLGSRYESEWVSLEAVKDAIMKKGPRFLLILADCCNNYGDGVSPKYSLMTASGSTDVETLESENIKKLFIGFRGYVIASGSKAGEFSWIDTSPQNQSKAGVFMDSFIWNLSHYTRTANEECTWETLMERVKSQVAAIDIIDGNGRHWRQHPEYRIERTREPKHKDPDNNIDVVNKDNNLKKALEFIADERNNNYARMDYAGIVTLKYFAQNATVKVVGRDNKTVVLLTSAKQYLDRIATSSRLRKIAILREERNAAGEIVQLVVHETYVEKTNK